MYAVVEHSGKQYKISEGDIITIDLTDVSPDAESIELEKVLFVSDGENIELGTPYVQGARVTASFASTAAESVVKGPKLYPTHHRRRKNSRWRIGHRQKYHQVVIDKIDTGGS